ncbi:hypothetical protein GCM10027093_21410 [Paraburkholderia jirisanensis]
MPDKRNIVMPTDEEDAAINRGIAADPDTYEVPAEDFRKMRPVVERDRSSTDEKKPRTDGEA